MAGIVNRIRAFARSPKGRRLTEQGRRAAADPRKRAQARQALSRLRGKHH
ncbi:hypothetical protein NLX86_21890 [Streptomyces sp. A3M-1-3]|nr:hypothetical protein [Streptomyces sp. A3M-1-3]MCP3820649.1 hypothetical protein [Streptomyces sp. A3M-1-3]